MGEISVYSNGFLYVTNIFLGILTVHSVVFSNCRDIVKFTSIFLNFKNKINST